jgi:hypothetical protein
MTVGRILLNWRGVSTFPGNELVLCAPMQFSGWAMRKGSQPLAHNLSLY